MITQLNKKQLKQFKNQSQSGEMMIKNTQNKKESLKHKSMLSIYKKNIIETHSQSGRSMIEMLGVLAIIAILSIGGIVGFRLAMNHYQASQIAHEMNMMRTDAQIKIAQGTEKLILGEPYDPVSESTLGHIQFNDDYPVDFACALADDETVELSNISCHVANAYYIELQNIPEGVCRPLAELVNGMNNIIAFNVNKNEYPGGGKCETGNGNVLNAVFSAEAVSELKVCAEDTDCESENAPHCDPSRHVCVSCYEDNQCAHSQYCEDNTCVTCESGVWNGEECVECTADDDCTDSDTPKCNTDTNTCVECIESGDCEEALVCKENTCSPCETEDECQAKGENYHCSNVSTCIQCAANEVWDDESKDCVECTADSDCTDTPDTPKCNPTENKCVQCLSAGDCTDTPETPQCDEASHTCKSCAEIDSSKPLWVDNECKACPEDQPWNGESCGCKDNGLCFTTFGNDYYCHKTKIDYKTDGETGACKQFNLPIHKTVSGNVDVWISTGTSYTYWNTCRLCEARAGKDGTRCSENNYQSPNMIDLDFYQCANKEGIKQTFIDNTRFYCHKTSTNVYELLPNDIPERVKEIGEVINNVTEGSTWLTDLGPNPETGRVVRLVPWGSAAGAVNYCTYGHDEDGGLHFPVCR